MKKLFIFFHIIIVLLLSSLVFCQTTNVTLQVTDTPDNQTWNSGVWQVQLQSPSGSNVNAFFLNGTQTPVPNQKQSGALSGTGGASITLTPNTNIFPQGSQWKFTVCPLATVPCYNQTVFIFGASQTVTLTPPSIRININGVSLNYTVIAYTDTEMISGVGQMYFNVIGGILHICTSNGGCIGSGYTSVSGSGIGGSGTNGTLPLWNGTSSLTNSNETESGGYFISAAANGFVLSNTGNTLIAGNTQSGITWTLPGTPAGLTWAIGLGSDNVMRCLLAGAVNCFTPVSMGLTGFGGNGPYMATSTCNTSTAGDVPTYDSNGNICDSGTLLANVGLANPMTTLGDDTFGDTGGAFHRLAGPTAPNGVPQFEIETPSGGLATAKVFALAGVVPRRTVCPSNVDTILVTDRTGYVEWNDAAACAVTLPQAGTTGFANNFVFVGCDINSGTATITPTTSTISYVNGSTYTSAATTLPIATGQCAFVYSDNANYKAILLQNSAAVVADSMWMFNNIVAAAPSGTQFAMPNGTAALQSTQLNAQQVMVRSGTIDKLFVHMGTNETGTSIAFTVMDGASAQAVTCTINNGSSTCNDTAHSFTFAAGDLISTQSVQTGTGNSTIYTIGIGYH